MVYYFRKLKKDHNMENELKQNIRKTGILMLIAAVIPFLFFLSFQLPSEVGWSAVFTLQLLYIGSCLFVLVWSSTKLIWKLLCRKFFRMLIFFAWLLLYPALCLGWYYLCGVCYFWIFHIHH